MDSEGPGLPRRRLSPWIALLFLVVAVIVLSGLVTSYIRMTSSPGQETPDLQPRIDQASTEQVQFSTESASINITETAVAAIATARPFTETAYAPTSQAFGTAYAATQTAYAPTYEATQTAYAPTLEAYQTASIATQTAYAPTGKAFQTIYPPTYEALLAAYSITDTAYAPTRKALQTAYMVSETAYAPTDQAYQTAYAATARAMGTTTVQPTAELGVMFYIPASSGSFNAAELAELEAENLDQGRYLFNAPPEMTAGNKYRVELRIVRDTQMDNYLMGAPASVSAFAAGLQSTGTPQIEKMQVGKLMKAKLTASDFAVTPLNQEEQVILGVSYTQWAWDVTPQRAGDLDLNLTISMKVIYEGEEGLYDHPVITKKIFVKVNPSYSFRAFAGDNWQWLTGTIVLPVLAWLWKKVRDQETGKNKKPGGTKKTRKPGATLDEDGTKKPIRKK